MTWDDIARKQHNLDHLRYPSYLSGEEWKVIEPFISPSRSAGRPRKTDMREVVNAIVYVTGSGCKWWAPAEPMRLGLPHSREHSISRAVWPTKSRN